MAAALGLGERGVGRTDSNPSVGCIVVSKDHIAGRGWTQISGRPHAEAMALEQAKSAARGSTIYVSLEPCAHQSERGPACADLLIAARPARVVIGATDPDLRTSGAGIIRLMAAGIDVTTDIADIAARASMAGFFSRIERGRPHITVKLATSLDGAIAMADGSSRWITGEFARGHAHLERARCDVILVGAGTVRADNPKLDVRLPGLKEYGPRRVMLGRGDAPDGWDVIREPKDIATLDCNTVLIEGGAATASAFLKAGLVDRLLLYRAPILIGDGKPCLGDIGLPDLGSAHGQWQHRDTRRLGKDTLEVYSKTKPA
jgi:diaminohydroxyphosphoribosylaminopyrimidine deaminase / 5-amino-6-(5-phosphoribosylamino)uracil reductase